MADLDDEIKARIDAALAPVLARLAKLEAAPAPAPVPPPATPPPAATPPAATPPPAAPPPALAPGIRKLTGAAGSAIKAGVPGTWSSIARHQYSKISAWNADQSLIWLMNRGGTPPHVFLNGSTLAPVTTVNSAGQTVLLTIPFWFAEFRWHPINPDLLVYVAGNTIGTWNVKTGIKVVLATLTQYSNLLIGPWEGNISDDGEWIMLGNGEPPTTVFPFNLKTGQASPPLQHGIQTVDFTSISASGKFAVVVGVAGGVADRTQVFDRATGQAVSAMWEASRPSHYDLTIDAAGDDVAVGVSKIGGGVSSPEDGKILSRRLRDGAIIKLTPFAYGVHTSARNVKARGKVVANFAGGSDYGPHSGKIVVVSTTGAPEQVVATHESVLRDYWDEPQPSFSPDGKMVIFASNKGGSDIGAYLAVLS